MKKTTLKGAIAVAALFAGAGLVYADTSPTLVINGETEMVTAAPAAAHLEGHLSTVYSGWVFRDGATQAMEADDFDNPGMLFVDQGAEMWSTVEGTEGKSCADCHGDASESMVGISATYPKWNDGAGEVRTVTMQVNDCRENRMGAEPFKYGGAEINALEAYIALQSRGMPVNVAIDGPAAETWAEGRDLYYTRFGQLELSCASCHEQNYGNNIRADHLSQGQINGFPVYRLKTAGLVSVHNRFKGCVRDTRAETFGVGSSEFVALELYVASRGNGLSVEAAAVRP